MKPPPRRVMNRQEKAGLCRQHPPMAAAPGAVSRGPLRSMWKRAGAEAMADVSAIVPMRIRKTMPRLARSSPARGATPASRAVAPSAPMPVPKEQPPVLRRTRTVRLNSIARATALRARCLEDEFFDGVAGGDDVEEGVGVRLVAGARVPKGVRGHIGRRR